MTGLNGNTARYQTHITFTNKTQLLNIVKSRDDSGKPPSKRKISSTHSHIIPDDKSIPIIRSKIDLGVVPLIDISNDDILTCES